MFEISSSMVMPDLQTQEIPLTLAQPGTQGTNKIPDFVKWTSGCDMRDFFFLSLLSLPGFLGVTLPHPPPSFQEPTGPNPSRSSGLPSPFCLEGAESAACLAHLRNSACYCQWGRCLPQGWRDQRGIFTQRQFYLFCVFNYLTVVVVFLGFRAKRWGRSWSKWG